MLNIVLSTLCIMYFGRTKGEDEKNGRDNLYNQFVYGQADY